MADTKIGIYTIWFPNGKSYSGQTCDFDKRMSQYKRLCCENQVKLYRALKKYGWDAVKVDFSVCLESMLDMCEKCTIAGHNSVLDGYNLDWGGKKNKRHSDETKAKMSESQRGDGMCHICNENKSLVYKDRVVGYCRVCRNNSRRIPREEWKGRKAIKVNINKREQGE